MKRSFSFDIPAPFRGGDRNSLFYSAGGHPCQDVLLEEYVEHNGGQHDNDERR